VLRGLVADWPLVREPDPWAQAAALAALDSGAPVDAVLLRPEEGGRIGYRADWSGFNFARNQLPLRQLLEQLQRYSRFERAPAVAVQSARVDACVPGLRAQCPLPLLAPAIAPRLWVGNALLTPTHFDESSNLACVLAGRRRFTLLPPQCLPQLAIGPLDFAPTGTPISLADLRQPDLQRFPALAEALPLALHAELAPGDALFIPPLWWHQVESLAPFNALMNFWWHGDPRTPNTAPQSGLDALWLAILALRRLPEGQRRHWAGLFEHYVFGPPEAATAHLPPACQGLLGELAPEQGAALRRALGSRLLG
jgi:hypothetical protein